MARIPALAVIQHRNLACCTTVFYGTLHGGSVMTSKPRTSLCVAMALAMGLGSIAPASGAPFAPPRAPEATPQVIQVQDDFRLRILRDRDPDRNRWDRDGRRDRDTRWDRDRFERRGDAVYWRGHRGFRERRPGYREYNGWWFPAAAFALGAIIGGTVTQQARPAGNAHVQWCYSRYRSYRASDNTFQPYNGPRRQCISPYS